MYARERSLWGLFFPPPPPFPFYRELFLLPKMVFTPFSSWSSNGLAGFYFVSFEEELPFLLLFFSCPITAGGYVLLLLLFLLVVEGCGLGIAHTYVWTYYETEHTHRSLSLKDKRSSSKGNSRCPSNLLLLSIYVASSIDNFVVGASETEREIDSSKELQTLFTVSFVWGEVKFCCAKYGARVSVRVRARVSISRGEIVNFLGVRFRKENPLF